MERKNAIQVVFLTWLPAIALLVVRDTQRWASTASTILFAVGLLFAGLAVTGHAKK